jgi:hypothetical protein
MKGTFITSGMTFGQSIKPSLFGDTSSPTFSPTFSPTTSIKGERGIRDLESGGNYKAYNPAGGGEGAVGADQYRWKPHKDKIRKFANNPNLTKEDFMNNPDLQDRFYNEYWKPKVLEPEARDLERKYKTGLPSYKLEKLVHIRGKKGAEEYLSGVASDKPESYNMSTSGYTGIKRQNLGLRKLRLGGPIPKKDATIYVDSKNHPRYKAYQDSLNVHNLQRIAIKEYNNSIPLSKSKRTYYWNSIGKEGANTNNPLYKSVWNLENLNKKTPDIEEKNIKLYGESLYMNKPKNFPKPKQQVVVKQSNKLTQLPNYEKPTQPVKVLQRHKLPNLQELDSKPFQKYDSRFKPLEHETEYVQGKYLGYDRIADSEYNKNSNGQYNEFKHKFEVGKTIIKKSGIKKPLLNMGGVLSAYGTIMQPIGQLIQGDDPTNINRAVLAGAMQSGVIGAVTKGLQANNALKLQNKQDRTSRFLNLPNSQASYQMLGNDVGYYAKGGLLKPEYEAEKGEIAIGNPQLEYSEEIAPGVHKVGGESHENGGTLGSGGEFMFSNDVMLDNNGMGILSYLGIKTEENISFSKAAELIGIEKNKFSFESHRYRESNTNKMMSLRFDAGLAQLAQLQEQIKQAV